MIGREAGVEMVAVPFQGGTPAELQWISDAETARWAPIIKASGFRAD